MGIKIFKTNVGLGYNKWAYVLRLDKTENGFNYLVIDGHGMSGDDYYLGEVIEDLEDIYIENTNFDITNSPLYDEFLFTFFIDNFFK